MDRNRAAIESREEPEALAQTNDNGSPGTLESGGPYVAVPKGAQIASSKMDAILGMITPEMKQALASRLGESAEGVQSGLGAATAATLSGLHRKAADTRFVRQILRLVEGGTGQRLVASLSSIASNGPADSSADGINRFLPMAFGTQQDPVASAVSQHAGLNANSGLELLKMAAALVLGNCARGQSGGLLNVGSLRRMLRAEASNLQRYLPASLLPGAPEAARRTSLTIPAWAARTLALAGALLLAYFVIRSLKRGPGRRSQDSLSTRFMTE